MINLQPYQLPDDFKHSAHAHFWLSNDFWQACVEGTLTVLCVCVWGRMFCFLVYDLPEHEAHERASDAILISVATLSLVPGLSRKRWAPRLIHTSWSDTGKLFPFLVAPPSVPVKLVRCRLTPLVWKHKQLRRYKLLARATLCLIPYFEACMNGSHLFCEGRDIGNTKENYAVNVKQSWQGMWGLYDGQCFNNSSLFVSLGVCYT